MLTIEENIMKTSELTGAALDWAVAKCENVVNQHFITQWEQGHRNYSTDWSDGGPIIEREKINVNEKRLVGKSESGHDVDVHKGWRAHINRSAYWMSVKSFEGPTPLIAAMRCYCCAQLGDEIEIPQELM
jgi:hypothetical protein